MDLEESDVVEWAHELGTEASALDFLVTRGLTEESIRRFHLGYVRHGYFGHSISIPYYLPVSKELHGFRFRRLGGQQPKYDAPKNQRAIPWNLVDLKEDGVFICEGEFDAMILKQMGFPAVGVPGTNSWDEAWRWLLQGSRAYVIFDGDEDVEKGTGGRPWGRRLLRSIRRVVEDAEMIDLPDGEDVTSLFVKGQLEEYLP